MGDGGGAHVVDTLAHSLGLEVSAYKDALVPCRAAAWDCKLCPFRAFSRKSALLSHLQYHTSPYYTAAAHAQKSKTLAQYHVAQAIFHQRTLGNALGLVAPTHDLLEQSARFIRTWNAGVSESELGLLKKMNQVPVVLVWTGAGPQFRLRSLTRGATRITEKQYYTPDFENLFVASALRNRGQLGTVIDELNARWAEQAQNPLLFAQNGAGAIRECMNFVFTNLAGIVQKALSDLKHKATQRGEWVAVSHDATFKCALSIIGQEKMSQRDGEFHAAHTFLGVTGACPGFSLQAKEGFDGFAAALRDRFTDEMIAQVRFLFTDSPYERFLELFPNIIGEAEDFVHLVIRIEYCTGGKRTACSRRVLDVQKKFLNPAENLAADFALEVYHGEAGQTDLWDDVEIADEMALADWHQYMRKPFTSHQEYVAQLKRVAATFPDEMKKKDAQGRAMLDIVRAGAKYRHYGFLRNHSVFRAIAGGESLPRGTTGNEAEHRLLKTWTQCVYQQHSDRLRVVQETHGLYRMMTNAWKNIDVTPKLHHSDRRALCLMSGMVAAGALRQGPGAPEGGPVVVEPASREHLYRPCETKPASMSQDQGARRAMRRDAWGRQLSADYRRTSKRRTLCPTKRVLTKTSSSSLSFQRVRRALTKKRARSELIRERVEARLRQAMN
jgi:hypothetical protein